MQSMSVPQPPQTLIGEQQIRLRDLGWLAIYSLRGLAELVRARLIFTNLKTEELLRRNQTVRDRAQEEAVAEPAHLARIAYVLPRISARLPWRSDCLIQAIAGQNWLLARRLTSEIQIGVKRSAEKEFAAHAWLVHDGCVISGGDISPYEKIIGEQRVVATDGMDDG